MKSFADLSDFLCCWYGCTIADLQWEDELPEGLNAQTVEYYRRFGQLTHSNGPFAVRGLPPPLGAQDIITPVEQLSRDEDGTIRLITENQGCWVVVETPDSDMIWSDLDPVTGDMPQRDGPLHDMYVPITEALITHTLYETVMSAMDAGNGIALDEWEAFELAVNLRGDTISRRFILPKHDVIEFAKLGELFGWRWTGETRFDFLVRKGDRAKGLRSLPYSFGRPQPAK